MLVHPAAAPAQLGYPGLTRTLDSYMTRAAMLQSEDRPLTDM